jgi:hypothetical protein
VSLITHVIYIGTHAHDMGTQWAWIPVSSIAHVIDSGATAQSLCLFISLFVLGSSRV